MRRTASLAAAIAAALLGAPVSAADAPVRTIAESDDTRTLVHEVVVDAPMSAVWKAISTAEGWKSWAVPVAWMPEPGIIETSYDPKAAAGDASTIRQQLIAAIPGRLLVFRTVKAPQGFPDFETYARVVNFFELEPVETARTRLRLTGVGYADSDAGRRLLGFFEKGNSQALEQLRRSVSGAR